jgi:signal transduction histidine kinase
MMAVNKDKLIHDLRNPLNTISINAELGKLTLERTGDIQKAIAVFDVILVECLRCGELVNELKGIRFEAHDEGDLT